MYGARQKTGDPGKDSPRGRKSSGASPLKTSRDHTKQVGIDNRLKKASLSFEHPENKDETRETSPNRGMSISDGQIVTTDRQRLRYRHEIELEMEACATLQQSGSEFDLPQLSDKGNGA